MERYVVFKISAGSNIGMGHLMRAGVLSKAAKARGWTSILVIDSNILASVELFGIERDFTLFKTEAELLKMDMRMSILVIDSYILKLQDSILNLNFKKKLAVVDIGYTPNYKVLSKIIQEPKLKGKFATHVDLGNLIVDPFFATHRRLRQISTGHSTINVVINSGGYDKTNFCEEIIEFIANSNLDVNVSYFSRKKIQNTDSRFHYFSPGSQYRNIVIDSDFVISTCGTSIWELADLAIPFAVGQAALNQEINYDFLEKHKLAVTLGKYYNNHWDIDFDKLLNAISETKYLNQLSSKLFYRVKPSNVENIVSQFILN